MNAVSSSPLVCLASQYRASGRNYFMAIYLFMLLNFSYRADHPAIEKGGRKADKKMRGKSAELFWIDGSFRT